MPLQSTRSLDSVQWDSEGIIWVKEIISVTEDGVVVAETFVRTSYAPGSQIPANAPDQVKKMAAIAWTPDVIAAYQDSVRSAKTPVR